MDSKNKWKDKFQEEPRIPLKEVNTIPEKVEKKGKEKAERQPVQIRADLHKKLKLIALNQDKTVRELTDEIIENYISTQPEE